jgi:hypothetical protein
VGVRRLRQGTSSATSRHELHDAPQRLSSHFLGRQERMLMTSSCGDTAVSREVQRIDGRDGTSPLLSLNAIRVRLPAIVAARRDGSLKEIIHSDASYGGCISFANPGRRTLGWPTS